MSDRAVRGFASDNAATIHPLVLESIARANVGHAFGYGHDAYTTQVQERLTELFGPDSRAFLVFNGSAANVLCMRAACRRWEAVICAESAHLAVDECGAPEGIAGVKLLTVPGEHGKLTPELIRRRIGRIGDEHAVQPRVVSISQSTELGTVYSLQETRALADAAHAHGLLLHVDGARLGNAAAALSQPLGALTSDAGVDLLSFGGTKNGLLAGEAVVFMHSEMAEGFAFVRKQTLQLASKMRFLAAQFDALLQDELWRTCAGNANQMAARLAAGLAGMPGIEITRPVQTNVVFAVLPETARTTLMEQFDFYVWNEQAGEVRWMCSWDTTEEDVDAFLQAIRRALA